MHTNLKIAALAFTGMLAVVGSASAADRDGFDVDQVTVAYSDGYTDSNNTFHAWAHRADAQETRAEHIDRYRPYAHDDKFHKHDTQNNQ